MRDFLQKKLKRLINPLMANEVFKLPAAPERLRIVSKNFFLHIHAAKIHLHALNPTFTFGLGLIAFFTFCTLLLTGILLMVHYTPSVERAYTSIQDIIYIVPAGKFIRNMHRWAGHTMIVVVFLHMVRVFFTAAYTGPRKMNWISGLLLFILVVLAGFSGYLLPWDQLAYWAVTIASNIAASARELTDVLGLTHIFDIGYLIKMILFGNEIIGQPALTRFFLLHVVFIPLTLIILMGYHFWRIRKSGGLAHPPHAEKWAHNHSPHSTTIPTWPGGMWVELALFTTLILLFLLFSCFVDAPLREMANPDFPENPAKSPWYFLGVQEMVSYSAFSGGLLLPAIALFFLFSIPFGDSEPKYQGIWFSGKNGKKITAQSVLFAFCSTGVILAISFFSDWFRYLPLVLTIIINPGTITAAFYLLWRRYIWLKTGSKRMATIALFTSICVGYMIFMIIGIWFRGANWQLIW
jgi:quinol-cytochrome oxidoreductase complex cytochrome b subunit